MFWLKWQQSRKEAKGCVIFWQCFNVGTDWQRTRDAALSTCVCVCDGFGVYWWREELECEEGQTGVPERRRGQHGEVLGVQSVNRKWGEISRGTAGKEKKKVDSQLTEFRAGLPGVRFDLADGVVAEVELLQRQQAVQPAFANLCQVVVVQLPAHTHVHAHSETLFCKQHYLSGIKHITKNAYRTSILLRPQKHPSIRRLRLFLCIFKERRLGRCWNVSPSTLRIRFLLSSLKRTQKV